MAMYLPKNYVHHKTILKSMTQNKFGLYWQYVLKMESRKDSFFKFLEQPLLSSFFIKNQPKIFLVRKISSIVEILVTLCKEWSEQA